MLGSEDGGMPVVGASWMEGWWWEAERLEAAM